ncbi:PREDICTED: NADH dehydrogenase [ubiquinone] 1 beta subcomplex subunit 10-A-like isoform X2 [Amphimedon queenslandica]|nr:PREDICTED: NADH dehydrogenase [ubiquinone] 1 beta subcomplex subunit 10-A-like isoform X2 [Amphimedon queenslandica]|eukprot:XP_003382776.1 PREDICTED: NADH dehydrogenase [ubiquinone] 1 beta subcomplex subunit 10-A-like isoform X2 [Amphimedon queenslandica]
MASKWPREYPRVPGLDEVEPGDFLGKQKARDQVARDRAIDLEVVRILRERVKECQRREEVNHLQRCREHVEAYMKAHRKYRSEGWLSFH